MFSRIQDRNIWLIYACILLLGLGYGAAIALIAIFLDASGYSKSDIGSLAAWFALGIVTFSSPAGMLIRKVSARWVLIASFAGYAGAVVAFPFLDSYAAIAGVRFLDGAFSAGIWVSCETILLSRAGKHNKAFITSLYAIAMAVGYVLGPVLARAIVAVGSMPLAFVASGVLSMTAAALALLRLDPDVPETVSAEDDAATKPTDRLPVARLLWRIKTSCFATFSYGYFQASVVLFLPLFLIEAKGVDRESTILIPAFFAAGMLLFSNVAGRLGDRFGHLLLMRVLAAIGLCMVAGFVFLDSYAWMCVAIFVAGAVLASISPVSLALQGVVVEPKDYARANGVYNVFYAGGMLLGPPITSVIYTAGGGAAMLYHLATLWGLFVVFTFVFARDDPAARPTRPQPQTAAR